MAPGTAAWASGLQRAFEPFFTTEGPEGTGLGLSTVYGVVKEAGGEVRLQSEPGVGTTVRVVLPAASTDATRTPVASAAAPPQGAGQTILVVEDDDAVREVVKRMLTRAGYQVVAAATAKDALEITANPAVPIDALLTDVVMPDISGVQLAERVRASHHRLPVLLMSGYTAGSLPSAPNTATGLPLIRKPFDAATLLQHLHDTLRRLGHTPRP